MASEEKDVDRLNPEEKFMRAMDIEQYPIHFFKERFLRKEFDIMDMWILYVSRGLSWTLNGWTRENIKANCGKFRMMANAEWLVPLEDYIVWIGTKEYRESLFEKARSTIRPSEKEARLDDVIDNIVGKGYLGGSDPDDEDEKMGLSYIVNKMGKRYKWKLPFLKKMHFLYRYKKTRQEIITYEERYEEIKPCVYKWLSENSRVFVEWMKQYQNRRTIMLSKGLTVLPKNIMGKLSGFIGEEPGRKSVIKKFKFGSRKGSRKKSVRKSRRGVRKSVRKSRKGSRKSVTRHSASRKSKRSTRVRKSR